MSLEDPALCLSFRKHVLHLDTSEFQAVFNSAPSHYFGASLLSEILDRLILQMETATCECAFEVSLALSILERMDHCRLIFKLPLSKLVVRTFQLCARFKGSIQFLRLFKIILFSHFQFLNRKKEHKDDLTINILLESITSIGDGFIPILEIILVLLVPIKGGPMHQTPPLHMTRILSLIVDGFCCDPSRFIESKSLISSCIDLFPSDSADANRLFSVLKQQIEDESSRNALEFLFIYVKILHLRGETSKISKDLLKKIFMAYGDKNDAPLLANLLLSMPTLFKKALLESLGHDPKELGKILCAISGVSIHPKNEEIIQQDVSLVDIFCHGTSLLFRYQQDERMHYDDKEKKEALSMYLEFLLSSNNGIVSDGSNVSISAQLLLIIGSLDLPGTHTLVNSDHVLQILTCCARLLYTLIKAHLGAIIHLISIYEFALCRLVSNAIGLFATEQNTQREAVLKTIFSYVSRIFSQIKQHSEGNYIKYMIPLCTSLIRILVRHLSDPSSKNLLSTRNFVIENLFELLNTFGPSERETIFALLSPEVERPFFKDLYSRFNDEFKYHGKV